MGPYARCPYCGAVVGQRMAVRVFKVGSLLLAVLGVAVLLYAATRSEPPTVDLGAQGLVQRSYNTIADAWYVVAALWLLRTTGSRRDA